MGYWCVCARWHADVLDQFDDFLWWWCRHLGNRKCDCKVEHCPNGAESIRLNTEEPVLWHVTHVRSARDEHDAFVLEYVQQRYAETRNHTGDGTFLIHPFVENTHHQCRENG